VTGYAELRHRGDLFLRVLGEQDHCKEMALEGIMAKKGPQDADDYATGRPAQNPQMKALQKAQGTPTRQSELPPFVGKDAMPGEKD